MTESNQCFVTECHRGALASVGRPDLPGQLRLCATHTEQFRQSSEGWSITWPAGDAAPTSVTAPSSDVLWAYKREAADDTATVAPATDAGRRGLPGLPSRAAGWFEARRASRHNDPK